MNCDPNESMITICSKYFLLVAQVTDEVLPDSCDFGGERRIAFGQSSEVKSLRVNPVRSCS
ncbi:hypothetical protein K438DRAFT_1826469 [Mycena galopus ATCC 62051]|nr:hypothetical protein K438DRAFT_1826469 [Mycena galopus ATCC 62051]